MTQVRCYSRLETAHVDMNFSVLTIFPEMFDRFRDHGIVGRSLEAGKISLKIDNIRDYAAGRHRVTDDRPFGGGSGMVMKPEPLAGAIRAARKRMPRAVTVLLSPQGRTFDQQTAAGLADPALSPVLTPGTAADLQATSSK